jgi:hypothetical protein
MMCARRKGIPFSLLNAMYQFQVFYSFIPNILISDYLSVKKSIQMFFFFNYQRCCVQMNKNGEKKPQIKKSSL